MIQRIEPNRFRIDFAEVGEEGGLLEKLAGFFQPRVARVDPYAIGQAVRAVMRQADQRDVDGRRLVWNQYTVFLSRADRDRLEALMDKLQEGLDRAVRQELQRLGGATVGEPVVHIGIDEEKDLSPGIGEILAEYCRTERIAPPSDQFATVRIQGADLPPVTTERVAGAASITRPVAGSLRLSWGGGHEAFVPPGREVVVGRPHPGAPEHFVALTGASRRISSRHLVLSNTGDAVQVERPASANPVQVGGRLVQKGGKLALAELPVDIDLSNGDLVIRLERVDEA